ncbi:MAG: hypothetical protein QMB75_08905 [Thauera sp.]
MSTEVNVTAYGEGQAAARDIVHNHIEQLVLPGDGHRLYLASKAPAEEIQARHAFVCEVGRVLRRRFVLHRSVYGHLGSMALMVAATLFAWGDPPGSPASLVLLTIAFGLVAPSAFWMVRERNALYAELRHNKDERLALERILVRMEAEAEVHQR